MNGGYGDNEWKVRLVTYLGRIVMTGIIIAAFAGAYSYVSPKVSDYLAERKQEELEEEQKLAMAQAEEEERLRKEEEDRLAREAEEREAEEKEAEEKDKEEQEAQQKAQEEAEKKRKEEKKKQKAAKSGYIIADSDSRYLSESDVKGFGIKKVNYAKNEIYARRGRMFQAVELQEYFNSKSWYNGTIAPEEFDESVFNVYEKYNARFLSDIEHGMNANGYQPK